jgi:hypothetical protein
VGAALRSGRWWEERIGNLGGKARLRDAAHANTLGTVSRSKLRAERRPQRSPAS